MVTKNIYSLSSRDAIKNPDGSYSIYLSRTGEFKDFADYKSLMDFIKNWNRSWKWIEKQFYGKQKLHLQAVYHSEIGWIFDG